MINIEKMIFAATYALYFKEDNHRALCAIRAAESVYQFRKTDWCNDIDWSNDDNELTTEALPEELRLIFEEIKK